MFKMFFLRITQSMCLYYSQYTAHHMRNWSNSISQKWSWEQKRWSQDHECANLINILLFLPLILRLVKNLLLLLWLLEAKCELSSTSLYFLSPPAVCHPKLRASREHRVQQTQRPTTSHCNKCLKQPRIRPESCEYGLELRGVFLSTINLPSPFPQNPILALFHSTNPLLFSLSFTWRSYSGFSKAHQAQALALCYPANPISLATRTKELNNTAPLQNRERGRERKKIQHKFLRIHCRSASIYAFSLSLHAPCHTSPSASPSPSCKGAQNGLEMASMGWDALPIDLEGAWHCSSVSGKLWIWPTMPNATDYEMKSCGGETLTLRRWSSLLSRFIQNSCLRLITGVIEDCFVVRLHCLG